MEESLHLSVGRRRRGEGGRKKFLFPPRVVNKRKRKEFPEER